MNSLSCPHASRRLLGHALNAPRVLTCFALSGQRSVSDRGRRAYLAYISSQSTLQRREGRKKKPQQHYYARPSNTISLSKRVSAPNIVQRVAFHTSSPLLAQPPTADALMENINDLYATAKDEFEIAVEETEANTVYAADDRLAAIEAFRMLKKGFEQAIRESDPETGKEVQGRVGPRIRELEAAIENMEKMAVEGD